MMVLVFGAIDLFLKGGTIMTKSDARISSRATLAGIAIGAIVSFLFLINGHPGLIGVGAAIGGSMAVVLNEAAER